MITLVFIGFVGGLVTGISPCILPVLPVIFATGAASGLPPAAGGAGGDTVELQPGEAGDARSAEEWRRRRRLLAVIGGLVLSFSVFTLIGSWLLSLLGLPQDALRWIGLVVLGVVGLGLVVPTVGDTLERPFARLASGRRPSEGGGLVLGLSLGLVFVPCAGPVLAAITVVSANHRYGFGALLLTAAFAVGIAVPLLAFALLGQRLAGRMHLVRSRAAAVRKAVGAVLIITALAIGLNLTDGLQRALPGYTNTLQSQLEANAGAKEALGGVTGNRTGGALASCTDASPTLQRCGTAPGIAGISRWLNTPGGRPLTLTGLRGRVVLVDFWTYSCINCQRTLPHLESWNRSYAGDGLTIIGVHTPEFAFEHVVSNVSEAARQLGVLYPIAIDNQYTTWNAYQNSYWPAEYLIDASGQVRHADFGEGSYGQTETFIRQLLVASHPGEGLPRPTDVADTTPTEQTTPESYLGYQHVQNLVGETVQEDRMSAYRSPSAIPLDGYAYDGQWQIGSESSTAGQGAALTLEFQARNVYLVAGGTGTIGVSVDGRPTRAVTIGGEPKLYQLVGASSALQARLSLEVSPGVQAYDFTFG
ncbi:MAG TPA: cytochrome c biogenesis protein DipZ [Acidimicrobiales bacterium]|nr:cytochrome c biogenesis protein DipZ [Acidimicrobiales bacterium]